MKKECNILVQHLNSLCTETAKIIGDSLFKNILKLAAEYRDVVNDTYNKALLQPGNIFSFHKLAFLLKTGLKSVSLASAVFP